MLRLVLILLAFLVIKEGGEKWTFLCLKLLDIIIQDIQKVDTCSFHVVSDGSGQKSLKRRIVILQRTWNLIEWTRTACDLGWHYTSTWMLT